MLLGVPFGRPPSPVAAALGERIRSAVTVPPATIGDPVARTLPGSSVLGVREAAGGLAGGRTFLVDVAGSPGYVVKIAPPEPVAPDGPFEDLPPPPDGGFPGGPSGLLAGATVCRQPRDTTGLPVPTVVHAGVGDERVPYPHVVMERLPGTAPGRRFGGLPPDERCRIADAVGRALDTVHGAAGSAGVGRLVPVGSRRVTVADPERPSSVVGRQVAWLRRTAVDTPAAPVVERAVEAVLASAGVLDRLPGARVVHGDVDPANVLVAGGRLTGLLDWDLAAAGDPAWDLLWAAGAFAAAVGPADPFPLPDLGDGADAAPGAEGGAAAVARAGRPRTDADPTSGLGAAATVGTAETRALARGYRATAPPDPTRRRRRRVYELAQIAGLGLAFRVGDVPDPAALLSRAEGELACRLAGLGPGGPV